MSDVRPVSSPRSVASGATNPTQAAAGASPPPLLPDPSTEALAGSDPLSFLYFLQAKDQSLNVTQGTQQITSLQNDRHQALDKELKAIQQEVDASHNHSFWDDLGSICAEVAKVAAVVASIAATVATCGAATPLVCIAIAGAVLSTAAFADGQLHVLRSLGVDDATAGMIDAAMSSAGGVTSLGAGAVAAAGVAGKAVTPALSVIKGAAATISGVGDVGLGASTIAGGEARASADQAAVDQVVSSALSDHASRAIERVIDQTRGDDRQSRQAMQTIANTKSIQNETTEAAATALKG